MSDEISVSALYLFLGDSLPSVSEKHFKQDAKKGRNADGQLVGPFVRFAKAVAEAAWFSVGDETVSKAMTEVAKLRSEWE